MKKPKELYGKKVCEKCVDAFANQRASAFIIDCFAFLLPIFILVPVIFILFPSTNESVVKIFIGLAGFVLLSLKDSFSGKSLGKRTCKIRVIDTQTGNPIGAKASFVRNFILFIPYINWITQIFCAIEMRKGPRTGDKWAHTKVIWDKYSDKSPFSFSGKTD